MNDIRDSLSRIGGAAQGGSAKPREEREKMDRENEKRQEEEEEEKGSAAQPTDPSTKTDLPDKRLGESPDGFNVTEN